MVGKTPRSDPEATMAAGASAAGKPGGAAGQKAQKGLGGAGNDKPLGGTTKPKGNAKP